jgi:hypothetical protein
MEENKTLGEKVLETHEKHVSSQSVEANDLSHEGGKRYMNQLIDVVEDHRNSIDEYYIQVFCKKPVEYLNRAISFRFFARRTCPDMMPDNDVWYVNNKEERLELMWSLPHWTEMPFFMETKDKHDPKLIAWIQKYADIQEYRRKKAALAT